MLNNNTEVNSNNSGYITIDCTGANMWSVKPELKTVDGELGWFLPSEYNGNSSALLLTSISSAVLPLLLNNLGINTLKSVIFSDFKFKRVKPFPSICITFLKLYDCS